MKPIHWIMLAGWFCSCIGNLQGQSCCDRDSLVTLCYLSSKDYCASNNGGCNEYSLDGKYMEEALKEKLLAPQNFGSFGTVPCNLEIKKLPINPSRAIIDGCGCDIIFMPSVMVEPATNNVDAGSTFIPQNILSRIRDWSMECPSNLVIASQGETTNWGYSMVNLNRNPNRPVPNTSLSKIFKEPFGVVNTFEQGGTYQGVFSTLNEGAEILARDLRERATIVLDRETNDLMIGDIGVFCNGPGDVSEGPMIVTNNDRLVCNIFALACQIASSTKFTERFFEDCETPISLPDGSMAYDLGFYSDTLTTTLGCDSIVNIEIIPCVDIPNIFTPNNDNRNDYFTPITDSEIIIETFQVFNRWGQLVYDNQTPNSGWDGNFNNQMAPADVYVYRIVYTNGLGSKRQIKTGDVTLLR